MRSSRALPATRLAVLLAAVLAAPPSRADPPALVAPIGCGTPGPIRQLFLDPALADARRVGSAGLSVRYELINSWSVPVLMARGGRTMAVQLDAQSDTLVFAARVPWSAFGSGAPGWRSRVASTIGWRAGVLWGGYTDGGIEAWHRLVGAYNFQRERYGRDHVSVRLVDDRGAGIDIRSARFSPGDLVLGTQVLVASGGTSVVAGAGPADPRWGLAARFELKTPTGPLSSAGGSGSVDAALSVLASVELARWAVLHAMAFGSAFSPFAADVAMQPRRWHGGVDLSLVLTFWGWAFIVEDRLLSPLMEGGWTVLDGGDDGRFLSSAHAALFRAHNQITGGVRRGPITVSFSEDWTPGSNPRAKHRWFYNSNAPDVVLAATFTYPW